MTSAKKEIELVEYFNEHWYKVEVEEGKYDYFPSVTSKLKAISKPGLSKWRGDIGNREADMRMFEAANRGSRIHEAFEAYNNGFQVSYKEGDPTDIIMQYQDEYLDLLKLHQFLSILPHEKLMVEGKLYSPLHREAGTVDLILDIPEGDYFLVGNKTTHLEAGIYVCDLKTGKEVYDDAYMQIAAYAAIYGEMTGNRVQGGLVLHTGASIRTGIAGFAARLRTHEELLQDYEDFRAVAKIWERQNKNAAPKIFDFPRSVKFNNTKKEK